MESICPSRCAGFECFREERGSRATDSLTTCHRQAGQINGKVSVGAESESEYCATMETIHQVLSVYVLAEVDEIEIERSAGGVWRVNGEYM